jgi:hypothetical protein
MKFTIVAAALAAIVAAAPLADPAPIADPEPQRGYVDLLLK